MNDWITTFSGERYYYATPDPSKISITDIAHALSNICRFAGHVSTFYSVAEHCVRVSYDCSGPYQFRGLMHDASEAFCVDIPRPLKRAEGMEVYRHYESLCQNAIAKAFNIDEKEPWEVKQSDVNLLHTEKRDLLPNVLWTKEKVVTGHTPVLLRDKIEPWLPAQAERIFLMRFYELKP